MLKKAYGNDSMEKTAVYVLSLETKTLMRFRLCDVGVSFDYDSVIHYEFIPEGQTVNEELYLEILKRLRDAIRRKRPEKWATNNWFLLDQNAPPHRSLIVKKYLVTTLQHPPYSPDLAPADFYISPRLKIKLKGHRFVDSDEVIENATNQLKDLSKNGFRECFEQLY
ncbi:hypothetical protein AVEN_231878-1 [Araneus ventricosus]|uniref:Mariner Mos1 transposase n=1 Tax=Araneus ventricosus TaxID=182803 RepID=A0A4Y2TPT8_ARAVE|nr:hypothetical protein AVEN_197685-1 [Araneus ventricosus]GBO02643.1 hypothetical protein AVEN_231878-1 [Araneus ventricosus]